MTSLLHAIDAQTADSAAQLHEAAAQMHEAAARLHAQHTLHMRTCGEDEKAARSAALAAKERDLAAAENARADQLRARQADMTARLHLAD